MKGLFGRNMMLALLLLVAVTAMAQLKEGHFFKSFENEHIAVEHAEMPTRCAQKEPGSGFIPMWRLAKD